MTLIPILYHNLQYPKHITPSLVEVVGHFDVEVLKDDLPDNGFSLHTEYSARKRKLTSSLVKKYPAIVNSQTGSSERAKPKLWIDEQWSMEFAHFLIDLLNGKKPHIIEIHPPNSRTKGLDSFPEYYDVFISELRQKGIQSKVLIENRNSFSLSGVKDFQKLSDMIDEQQMDLKLILDFPQLLNYEKARTDEVKLSEVMEAIEGFKHNIDAFHLWGQVGHNSHRGDMDDYFKYNSSIKSLFLQHLQKLFVGSQREIYFIPEVNFGVDSVKTNEVCLANIVADLESVGFKFS